VEDVHLTDPNSVYFNVGLESESETSEVLSLPGSSEELLTEQPLNLVKKDRKRKPSSIEAMIEVHNRDVHANMDRLVCPDCGKLFTSKRSLFGHKKEKHTGAVEIFPCPDCGKNFSKIKFKGPQRFITFWQEVPLLLLWADLYKSELHEPTHQENPQWPSDRALGTKSELWTVNVTALSAFSVLFEMCEETSFMFV